MTNPLNRETMKASDVVRAMQQFIEEHGDRPVLFTDGFYEYGISCHPRYAANYDSARCMLVRAFSLVTGRDGPNVPIALEHA